MVIPIFKTNVYTTQTNNIFDSNGIEQLDDYIVSGTGTQDDPYIISDDCPYK